MNYYFQIEPGSSKYFFQVFGITRYFRGTLATVERPKISFFQFFFQYFLNKRTSKFFVALGRNNSVIGYCQLNIDKEHEQIRNYLTIFVRPSYSRNGVGTALLNKTLENKNEIFVRFLNISNAPMPHHENSIKDFFEKSGFIDFDSHTYISKFGKIYQQQTMVKYID